MYTWLVWVNNPTARCLLIIQSQGAAVISQVTSLVGSTHSGHFHFKEENGIFLLKRLHCCNWLQWSLSGSPQHLFVLLKAFKNLILWRTNNGILKQSQAHCCMKFPLKTPLFLPFPLSSAMKKVGGLVTQTLSSSCWLPKFSHWVPLGAAGNVLFAAAGLFQNNECTHFSEFLVYLNCYCFEEQI